MGMLSNFIEHVSMPFLVILGLLYVGGAISAYLKPGVGDKLEWDSHNAARGVRNVLVWMGVRFYRRSSTVLRWALDTLVEASADIGEWFTGDRAAHV
jgi:hypothetical protein